MDTKLSAKTAGKIFDGEGGSYYSWLSRDCPILSDSKLGGGKLFLHPLGLALPHYADSSKIGYVLQGSGTVGFILPTDSKEKVFKLEKGDIIPVPVGVISWWFNDGDTDFKLVFLGETSKAHHSGEFTYFFLAGTLGLLNGFSSEFVTKALDLNEEEANKITKTQTGVLIVKLKQSQSMPEPCKGDANNIVVNIDAALPNLKAEKGGRLAVVTNKELAILGGVGLSAITVELQSNSIYVPEFSLDFAFQVIYIVRGSGKAQVVGIRGNNVLNETVEAGQLVVVPRFFVFSMLAGGEGMEWFSVVTTQLPMFGRLAGKTSVWKALSPQVLQASLSISSEIEKCFKEKMSNNDLLSPSPN